MIGVRICLFLLGFLCNVCTGESAFVTLSSNGPVVLGANITFKAELFTSYGTPPSGSFRFHWRDNAISQHTSVSEGPETIAFWNVSYPAHTYAPGPYEVEVIVDKYVIFYWPICSQRINFNITALLNGQMSLLQSGHLRETGLVSSKEQVTHRVDLTEADSAFLTQSATSILTYWFVDCTFYGQTPGYEFNFSYTQPGKIHNVEGLIIASYEPPSTTTSTTPTPPTVSPNTTSATTPSTKTTTTVIPTSSTVLPSTSAATTTTVAPKNISFEINSNEISNAMHISHVQNMPLILPAVNTHNETLKNNTVFVPYVCLNSSIIPPDPNKTYGYFHRRLVVRAPVENVSVLGTNWLQHGDMLNLQVYCNGSAIFEYCIRILPGSYNVTGNETCTYFATRPDCRFEVVHYFREPSQYTVLIIIRNDVSKVVTKVGINIYEDIHLLGYCADDGGSMYSETLVNIDQTTQRNNPEDGYLHTHRCENLKSYIEIILFKVTKHAQLSVIVVPVSCSLIAVILIVFGIAYYVQSKNRYIIEVADFDFGQVNDMEYKTFRERLRESMSTTVNRSEIPEPGGSWSPSRKYGPMN